MSRFLHQLELTIALSFLFVCMIFISNELSAQSQTITLKGKISGNGTPISRALIELIDKSDTTNQVFTYSDASGNYTLNMITDVNSSESLPSEFSLEQNYPNPFSNSTAISYKLNKQTDVQLTIFDALGREVRKFNISSQNAGIHGILWDARNNFGAKLASGVYFYRMQVGNKTLTKKMVLGNSSNNNYIPLQSFSVHTENLPKLNTLLAKGVYKIRVSNNSRTSPAINTKLIDNVSIVRDTTIDINVDKQTIYGMADIYADSLRQIIRGFGASNIILWRPDMTTSEIETAFGTGDGQLGFTILRIMVENDSTRWGLYLPTAKKALSMGAIVIASPWFAPTDMVEKVNNVSRVIYSRYADYAKHLNSFLAYMKRNGINIYGISIQNEPDITDQWTSWTANEIFNFVKNYAGTIKGAFRMAPESFHYDNKFSDPILNDPTACANTDIVCGHIYGSGLADYPLARSKGKEFWMTEYLINSNGNGANMDTSWNAAMATATSINSCMSVNMSAYVWWYIVRYYGPIGDGTNGPAKGSVTKKGYVMSQFSRFVRPGYYRVLSNVLSGPSVAVTAYKDPATNKMIFIAVNSNSEPVTQTFRLLNKTVTKVTPYVTSKSKNCLKDSDITVTNSSFTYKLEPSSITTFTSN